MTPLGERIRALRRERGIGQDRLALKANYDQSSLSKLERGGQKGVSAASAARIAAALGVSFQDLVRGTDHEHLLTS